MKKLDLTNPDDILEFGFHYEKYKNTISLPVHITLEIEKCIQHYDIGIITSCEVSNRIIDIIVDFMKDLNVEIKRS